MNLWLIVPGVVLIVACAIPTFHLDRDGIVGREDDIPLREVLRVSSFLVGVALLLEGLSNFTGG